jgi:hypothetical protein
LLGVSGAAPALLHANWRATPRRSEHMRACRFSLPREALRQPQNPGKSLGRPQPAEYCRKGSTFIERIAQERKGIMCAETWLWVWYEYIFAALPAPRAGAAQGPGAARPVIKHSSACCGECSASLACWFRHHDKVDIAVVTGGCEPLEGLSRPPLQSPILGH